MTAFASNLPVQIAQAAPSAAAKPIGHIDTATGKVQVTHADGVVELLSNGDPVYQGDLLFTGGNAAVGMVFTDETVFSMGEFSRMTLDEMVYDAEAATGSLVFTLTRGAFTFVSGQVAKTDSEGMSFKTSSAIIGIRGSAGGININDLGHTLAALFEELGGIFGEMTFTTGGGVQVVNQPLLALKALGYNAPPSNPFTMTIQDMGANFGSALKALPNAVEHLPPAFREEVDKVAGEIQAARAAGEDGPGDGNNFIVLDDGPITDIIPPDALGVLESQGYFTFMDFLDYLMSLATVIIKHQIRYTPEPPPPPEPETLHATAGADALHGNAASTRYVFNQGGGLAVTDPGSDFYDANPGIATITNKDTITDDGGDNDKIILLNLDDVTITVKEKVGDAAYVTANVYNGAIATVGAIADGNLHNTADIVKSVEHVWASTGGVAAGDVFIPDALGDVTGSKVGYIVAGDGGADNIDLSGEADPVGALIFGKGGDDFLTGTSVGDKIYGGAGIDEITGGKGADKMDGGAGTNTFKYTAANEGGDTINNFVSGADKLDFSRAAFNGDADTDGALDPGAFETGASGSAATNAGFFQNTTSKELYYDPDGNTSAGDEVLIATFDTILVTTDITFTT